MARQDRLNIARQSYLAFVRGDRTFFEDHLSEDYTFSSPPDPHLDRAGWFEHCWPAAGGDRRSASFGSSTQVMT